MRIIAGRFRGRKLAPIEGRDIRPTLDRVRESVFNILTPYMDEECIFLDLFTGTGANGLEALSRGVQRSIFVDSSPASLKIAQQNAEKLNIQGDCVMVRGMLPDKLTYIATRFQGISVCYADPPFGFEAYDALLQEIDTSGVVEEGGLILIEHDVRRAIPAEAGKLLRYREERYGHTQVSFYRGDA
ncbi:16S rRNA (guanine(966)-N(2))-methyltransferase RsmD [bacterium AH-315-P07]|nr:16S rRNA (guanine(966)-N(2))-methyltransferase RsmD [bacterium AH-315-P07]